MENTLQLFDFQGNQVRTLEINGEIFFIATDLGKALGLANVRENVSQLDDDEKGVRIVDTLGGPQQMSYVTEPGMYALVAKSRKDIARAFDRWVRHEVLPSIRKTGSYSLHGVNFENLVGLDPCEVKDNKKLLRRIVMFFEDAILGMQEKLALYKGLEKHYHPEQAHPRGRRDVHPINVYATDENITHLMFRVSEKEIVVQTTFIFEEGA